jgi:hypothetical protein
MIVPAIARAQASLSRQEFPMRRLHSSLRSSVRSSATALLLTAALAAPAVAQDRDRESKRDDAFTWSGTIPSGRRIMIKNINGAIEV